MVSGALDWQQLCCLCVSPVPVFLFFPSQGVLMEQLPRRRAFCCCGSCGDSPLPAVVLQCTNGHLMCAGCFTHLLADARLRDETATCPNCRTVISRELCSRNLAVEKAVCELPTECQFCASELPRAQIERHEAELCEERCVHSYVSLPSRYILGSQTGETPRAPAVVARLAAREGGGSPV